MQAQQNDVISPEQAGTLHGLFVERARRTPDKVAYRYFQQNDRTTFDGTTSHSTKRANNARQVAGYGPAPVWRDITWREMLCEVARWQAALAELRL